MNNNSIAFVLPDFRGGGAERVMITLANYLSQTTTVYFFVGNKSGENASYVDSAIPVIELGCSGIKSVWKLNLLARKYQVASMMGTLNMAHAVSLSNIFLRNKCKTIARIGNTISTDLNNHKGIKKLIQYLYQYSLIFSDEIVVQSEYMRKDLVSMLNSSTVKKKAKLIYNPINHERVNSLSNVDISQVIDEQDLITIGRLEQQKDIETTLIAFSKYLKVNQTSKLHIFGNGSLRLKLERLTSSLNITDNVIFHGYVENPYPYIKAAKFLVMSSLYEGFSNVILESLVLNTPVIASDCPGGNSEIIQSGINGYLFKVKDSNDMYEKILLADSTEFSIHSLDNYHVGTIARQYKKVIFDE
ncbi:glycosyltransferase [Photobacterium minamisatsumaniensis]|uniref:glycosyltransferase n=1 Tax=Photobacterium minamisatsumaniensis TaxID=2910233 RepID=UPI003D0D9FE1